MSVVSDSKSRPAVPQAGGLNLCLEQPHISHRVQHDKKKVATQDTIDEIMVKTPRHFFEGNA
jgi:hypothetical protein